MTPAHCSSEKNSQINAMCPRGSIISRYIIHIGVLPVKPSLAANVEPVQPYGGAQIAAVGHFR